MRLSIATFVVSALLAAGLALPVASSAAEKSIWGPLELPDGRSAFPLYRDLGVDTLQKQLSWAAIAPNEPARPADPADPAYRWPRALDSAVAEAAAARVRLALLVTRSPSWANGGRSEIHAPEPDAFAEFMAAASRRYPSVRRWMVWGEPNRGDRFQPNGEDSPAAPRAYALILDAAYRELKRVSRHNVVIGGMTWTGGGVKPADFLRLMRLPDGRAPRLDLYGHNPFPFRFPNVRERPISGGWRDISDVDTFSRELRSAYGRRMQLWLSEFTVISDRRSKVFGLYVTQRQQARWLAAAYRIADSTPTVGGLGWLNLLDQVDAPGSANWGLMTASGVPKPAYASFWWAPSARFRPAVRVARRVRSPRLASRGLRVEVRPRLSGRTSVELLSRKGRRLARVSGPARRGKILTLRLRRARLRQGRYILVVRATRGESVRRSLTVR